MLALRPVPYDHPDSRDLAARVQRYYRGIYGDEDLTPLDPRQFDPPGGLFLVGYYERGTVACGGWRARDHADDPVLADGDAELKRMYVVPERRGLGIARRVLAELERVALEAGRRRIVLETGVAQPEAIALYLSSGYTPAPKFGIYRREPGSRCFAKPLVSGKRGAGPVPPSLKAEPRAVTPGAKPREGE